MDETHIDLDFGDGRYRFWLPMARIVEVERLCGDKSLLTIHDELGNAMGMDRETGVPMFAGGGQGRIRDIYEVIRCGAVGGNARLDGETEAKVSPLDAKRLVDTYVDGRPIAETLPVAWSILEAAINGVRLKKKAEADEESPNP